MDYWMGGGGLKIMEVVNSRFLRTIRVLVVVLLASFTVAQETIIYANDVEEVCLDVRRQDAGALGPSPCTFIAPRAERKV